MISYSAVVLCAGKGKRTGLDYNKMLYKMNDRTVFENTMQVFLDDLRCTQIVVVTTQEEQDLFKELVTDSKIVYTLGGKERQDSVYNGLQVVDNEYVMIHDGARPYLQKQSLDALCNALEKSDACLLMVPSKDTVKEVIDGKVVRTLKRENLMQAQTPQAFKTSVVLDAYKKGIESSYNATDDAQMVEVFSDVSVQAVMGDYNNKKITTVEDL